MDRRVSRPLAAGLLAALLGLLASCGGGSEGGIGGTGVTADSVSYGGITGFGSVWVNGVEYATGSAAFRLDDSASRESALRVGMVVQVEGSLTQRRADRVHVEESVEGRVDEVLDANRIVVMGQLIQLDAQTRFEGGVRPALGDWVDAHGLVVADGVIAAGYVERKPVPAAPVYTVKGFVRSQDTAAQTFTVGGLLVRYGSAITGDMPAGSWNGLLVSVRGSSCTATATASCATLGASKVEPAGARVANGLSAEVEGYVTSADATGLSLGTQRVVVTASTVFERGTAADLVVGAKLEAEGSVSAGVLTASKISFRDSIRLEADVAAVSAGGLTLAGLPGIVVQADSLTRFKGGAQSLAQLAPGQHLRVRGRPAAGNAVIATEIELRSTSPDERLELQGPVSAVAAPAFTLLGVVVDTTGLADPDFRDVRDQPVGRAAFFAGLVGGDVVKASGRWRNGAIRWDEVELED